MENIETAEEKARYIPILFPETLIEQIDDYRYTNRIPSRAETIRVLIENGLQSKKPPASAKPEPVRRRKSGD